MAKSPIFETFHAALTSALATCDAERAELDDSSQRGSEVNVFSLAKDLGLLLHSQCTKLAIAAKPPRTGEAVDQLMAEIEKLLPMFGSLCTIVNPSIHGMAIVQFIRKQCKYALLGLQTLIEVIQHKEFSEPRLSRTAILWESCVALQTAHTLQELVSAKLNESLQMIDDAIDDLESWQTGETDLNFDSDIDKSDSGSDVQTDKPLSTDQVLSSPDVGRGIAMMKRIQLLLRAVDKRRVTKTTTIVEMNDIFNNCALLAIDIDNWAVEVQEEASVAFVKELEKIVVLRVEELLDQVTKDSCDEKWLNWCKSFRLRWLEEVTTLLPSK